MPLQVCIAPDGFAFVADCYNHRVQPEVLTPTLDFHGTVGTGLLDRPAGVCANADVVVASEWGAHRIAVFNRRDGALLRPSRFGCHGSAAGEPSAPRGLCFMSGDRHVAVVEFNNHRVSVFSVDGAFVSRVGVGVLLIPQGVACSAFDELVVADTGNHRVVLFSADGQLLATFGRGAFDGVALRGCTVHAHAGDHDSRCVVSTL
jgi:DNA-binding beta-propeller fold protein YncE